MARTPGSGWGAGPIKWQVHDKCGKKKAYYDWQDWTIEKWYCTACKERFFSDTLAREKYQREQKTTT